jgi:DNA-binding MarR family transcriptional regulator
MPPPRPVTRTAARRPEAEGEWRWHGERETSILFDVFALGQQVRTLLQIAMRDAGMRADDYAVYSVLFEAGPLTLTEAAHRLGMPVTTAADYLRAMVARGHASKQRHPSDSRAFLLSLTPAGTSAHRRAHTSFERAYQAIVRELPPLDEAHTRKVLQQLAASAARATAALRPGREP